MRERFSSLPYVEQNILSLLRTGPRYHKQVVAELGEDPTVITNAAGSLESKGLINMKKDPSEYILFGRKTSGYVKYSLTKAGQYFSIIQADFGNYKHNLIPIIDHDISRMDLSPKVREWFLRKISLLKNRTVESDISIIKTSKQLQELNIFWSALKYNGVEIDDHEIHCNSTDTMKFLKNARTQVEFITLSKIEELAKDEPQFLNELYPLAIMNLIVNVTKRIDRSGNDVFTVDGSYFRNKIASEASKQGKPPTAPGFSNLLNGIMEKDGYVGITAHFPFTSILNLGLGTETIYTKSSIEKDVLVCSESFLKSVGGSILLNKLKKVSNTLNDPVWRYEGSYNYFTGKGLDDLKQCQDFDGYKQFKKLSRLDNRIVGFSLS